ncbi:MAG: NfeD family protein, partial [Cellvibrionaceae bacterium]|nr:NfeD family protein [Cellvibrionaceae bacterium]
IQFISEMGYFHWFSLATLLLIVEVVLPGGFFLGAAAGAVFTGVLHLILGDLSWQWALMVYSLTSVVFSYLAVTRLRGLMQAQDDHPQLNNRLAGLIGAKGRLVLGAGHSPKVKIGDTLWAIADTDGLAEGMMVVVTDIVEDELLRCEAL